MSLFLVVPFFNEAARWDEDYWASMVRDTDATFVFVNDGSTDDTGNVLASFASQHRVLTTHVERNAGKAEAVRHGWQEILRTYPREDIDALGFVDADGAFTSEDVSRLIHRANSSPTDPEAEAWWSSRVALAGRNIQRNMWRHYLGRGVATFLSWGEASIPYDTQSGLKIFQPNDFFLASIDVPFKTRWLFEMEILIRFAQLAGRPMNVWEMPLSTWIDVAGSKVTGHESVRVARELIRLKSLQRRGRRALLLKEQ
jgi:glycosyltransferase involved in cell wall biosynthesis